MKFFTTARAVGLVAVIIALPITAHADGHTSEFAGSKGYVGEKGYVSEVAPRTVAQQRYASNKQNGSQPKRVRRGPIFVPPGCPPKFNGMFRGTLYCIDGQPIP